MSDFSSIPFFNSDEILGRYEFRESILSFIDIILSHNQSINLVSRETSRSDLIRIAADCLIPLEFIDDLSGRFFDIGPGAGFPSIIYMLARPGGEGYLIERTGKKAMFLNRTVELLGLNASVIDGNFIEVASSFEPHSFDFGLMKYVRLDKKIFAVAVSLLKPSGFFIYYSEFEDKRISIPDSVSVDKYHYYLDDRDNFRTLTVFSRIF